MRSLQSRLLLGTGVVVAVNAIASGVAIYAFVRSALYAEFDGALLDKARALASQTEKTEQGIEFEIKGFGFEEFTRDVEPDYFQLWLETGSVLSRSTRLEAADSLDTVAP